MYCYFVNEYVEVSIRRIGTLFPVFLNLYIKVKIFESVKVLSEIPVDLNCDALLSVQPDRNIYQSPNHLELQFSL